MNSLGRPGNEVTSLPVSILPPSLLSPSLPFSLPPSLHPSLPPSSHPPFLPPSLPLTPLSECVWEHNLSLVLWRYGERYKYRICTCICWPHVHCILQLKPFPLVATTQHSRGQSQKDSHPLPLRQAGMYARLLCICTCMYRKLHVHVCIKCPWAILLETALMEGNM